MNDRGRRNAMNGLSLVFTILVMLVAFEFSDGGDSFANRINQITETLDRAVLNLDVNVEYTNFTDSSAYLSRNYFGAGGMAGLYNLTNHFIDVFAPSDILMDGVISLDSSNSPTFQLPDPKTALQYYARLVAIVLFLILCVALFPFCGLCICCCRCCGNCGAKPTPSNKKKDTCKKVIYATLLIVSGTGLLFCVVCAFGSNQQMQDGIEHFPSNLNNSIQDTKTFMDSTNSHVKNLLITNYEEFTTAFDNVMNKSADIAMQQLTEYSKATAVSDITNFANNITNIKSTLYLVKTNTNKLRVYASQLNDAIRKVKRDLITSLERCAQQVQLCSEIKGKVDKLQTTIDFNSVPDISDTISSLQDLQIDEITAAANSASQQITNLSFTIGHYLNGALSDARIQIANSKVTIRENLDTLTDTIDKIKSQMDSTAKPLNTAQKYINDYSKFRYYAGLAISCVLLLVTICIVLGLICGICGKRPDGYSDNCCNKGAGGQFLMCAVMIMLLFGAVFSVLTLVSMLLGVFTEKAICDPVRNPDPNQYRIIRLLDEFNLDNMDISLKPSVILNNCKKNMSLYQTFGLQKQFNLTAVREKIDITNKLNKLNMSIGMQDNFELITEDQLEMLKKLENINADINVDKFKNELDTNLTSYSLDDLSQSLKEIVSKLNDLGGLDDLKNSIQLSIIHVDSYNEKLVIPLKNLATNLTATVVDLDSQLRMNHTSFSEAISNLIDEITEANKTLATNASAQLNETTIAFKGVVLTLVNGYLNRTEDEIENNIGKCGPLNLVIQSSLTSTCEKILLPWNGFWFSLFWTVILYVITIVISIRLANLYQRHKPYDQYVETEYLYDAYADRGDHIPLNSRGGKRGKKKGKKPKRYEDRGGREGRDYAHTSHPPDGRYADMAPKHWDQFPNGGPPHYQRAPTEYERPPPYYYPGSAGDR